MPRGRGKRRQGKIVTGGHHQKIEELAEFLSGLEKWPEIKEIRIGAISTASRVGRRNNTTTPTREKSRGMGLGGGFSFKVNDWARVGSKITGVRCTASFGRAHQTIILTSDDLPALRARLVREGYATE